jgi:cyanophycinase-like exopeptidase
MRLLAVAFCAYAACAQTFDSYMTGSPADVRTKSSAGLLLSGGGGDVDEAFKWLIAKSGGGDIVVLRAWGSDGYNKYIAGLGAVDSVHSIVTKQPDASHDSLVLEAARDAEAIFIAAGDQWNYIRMWRDTPVGEAINAAWRKGVPGRWQQRGPGCARRVFVLGREGHGHVSPGAGESIR